MSQCLLENGAKGMITFVEEDCQGNISVKIDASFTCTDDENCAADNHGFHVHMSAPSRQPDGLLDCGSAGGHFASESQQHGRPSDEKRFDTLLYLFRMNVEGILGIWAMLWWYRVPIQPSQSPTV